MPIALSCIPVPQQVDKPPMPATALVQLPGFPVPMGLGSCWVHAWGGDVKQGHQCQVRCPAEPCVPHRAGRALCW